MTDQQVFIAPHDARCVLDIAGEDYRDYASGFTNALVNCMFRADGSNLERLAQGFPGLVDAVRIYKHWEDGPRILRSIADRPGSGLRAAAPVEVKR